MHGNLDKIDIKIAERVGLSQSPCWRRIQRLRDEGYIKAQVAIVDWQKLGFQMQIFAHVKMATRTDDEVEKFIRAVNAIPEITECYSLFGERDFMLKIMAPDVQWYQSFVFNVLRKLPGVADVQSTVTLLEAKYTTAVPLEPSHIPA
jgi:Lrp/AsnC family transcriptional regulator